MYKLLAGNYTDLKYCFCSISLYIVSVDDNLYNSVPDFLTDIISSHADQVEDDINVPCVVHSVFLSKNGDLQYLKNNIITVIDECNKLGRLNCWAKREHLMRLGLRIYYPNVVKNADE